ncbi:MAG TPA: hypothetical protein VHL79_21620 [Ramlibacter sp.]|nr:hypothetical protein [Ramlibacter sp.]
MQTITPASPIPVPDVESDTPVAVIPAASVAPLDGPPDGERINTFVLTPKTRRWALEDFTDGVLGGTRSRVVRKPLAWLGGALALGLVIGRVLR